MVRIIFFSNDCFGKTPRVFLLSAFCAIGELYLQVQNRNKKRFVRIFETKHRQICLDKN